MEGYSECFQCGSELGISYIALCLQWRYYFYRIQSGRHPIWRSLLSILSLTKGSYLIHSNLVWKVSVYQTIPRRWITFYALPWVCIYWQMWSVGLKKLSCHLIHVFGIYSHHNLNVLIEKIIGSQVYASKFSSYTRVDEHCLHSVPAVKYNDPPK